MIANRPSERRANIAFGLLVLIAGVALLIAQLVNFELPEDSWPLVIVVAGAALLLVGLVVAGEAGTGLTVAGTIVATVGLILLYQNTTGHWESWAYAWALVGPTAPGVGLVLAGIVHRNGEMVRNGTNMTGIGLALFAVGLVFFEGIIGISGERPEIVSNALVPGLLILIGVVVVGWSLFGGRRGNDRPTEPTWPTEPTGPTDDVRPTDDAGTTAG